LIRAGAAALVVMGVLGERTKFPRLAINQPQECAWFGAGGEVQSPSPASGSQGATIVPLVEFSANALTAFNPRRVDFLHHMLNA
jgi:hypothetical protein